MLFHLGKTFVPTFLLLAATSLAPYQCASEVDPNRKREEEPGEALYGLAEQFEAQGDTKARTATLRFIVEKYPTSRFAEMARGDLEELDRAGASPRKQKE